MRVVNAATNLGIAGVPVQLWQTVDGRTWVQRAALTTDSTGLARVTRTPTDPVTYQARFPGAGSWAPSASMAAWSGKASSPIYEAALCCFRAESVESSPPAEGGELFCNMLRGKARNRGRKRDAGRTSSPMFGL